MNLSMQSGIGLIIMNNLSKLKAGGFYGQKQSYP